MGSRSMVSSCLTSLRHMGQRTLRFLYVKRSTCKTFWGRECRRCARSGSWCGECVRLYRTPSCRAGSYPCPEVAQRTTRFNPYTDLEGFLLVWKRRWSDSLTFSSIQIYSQISSPSLLAYRFQMIISNQSIKIILPLCLHSFHKLALLSSEKYTRWRNWGSSVGSKRYVNW